MADFNFCIPEILTYDDAIKWYAKCMRVSEREAKEDAEKMITDQMLDEKCERDFAVATFIEYTAEMTPEMLDATEKAAKAAGVVKHQAKAVDAYGKKRTREHKPDEDKRMFIAAIKDGISECLWEHCEDTPPTIVNDERELLFTYNNNTYRITLAKVRGPNKKKG